MAGNITLATRLQRQLKPTGGQLLFAFVAAGITGLIATAGTLRQAVGITTEGVQATQSGILSYLREFLSSTITEHLVLVLFWSIVGLISYLICWAFYSATIEARNEVTIRRKYTNLGHHTGMAEQLAIKAACGLALIISLVLLSATAASLLSLIGSALQANDIARSLLGVGAYLVLAIEIYLVAACAQLALTPWYRPHTFTA